MPSETLELPFIVPAPGESAPSQTLAAELQDFCQFGKPTRRISTPFGKGQKQPEIVTFVNEFWTSKQRAASRLHEVSYRACFKPQLPRFFIERLTRPGDIVYDPFMGRGTTPIEAALLGRVPAGNDINPLSLVMTRPRLYPPAIEDVEQRLSEIDFHVSNEFPNQLLAFYHPDTLRQIAALRSYLLTRRTTGSSDALDDWICLVALNRLTGHSSGFFSVYTLP